MSEPQQLQVDHELVDRSHLTNSRPLIWDRIAATERAAAALGDLLDELEAFEVRDGVRRRRRRADDRARLRVILEAIALDLFASALNRPGQFLAYSRRDGDYVGMRRYGHPQATLTTVVTVADLLVAAGYAEGRAGSYRREDHGFGQSGRGYRSRLRATDALVAFLGERHGLTMEDLGLNREAELVRLKGPPRTPNGVKPLVDYEDTDRTRRMREDLRCWAEVVGRHDVRLVRDGAAGEAHKQGDETDGAGEVVAHGECRLYRVFNNGRWDHGGRFYGGWWMTLSKAERRGITIDGEPTVELDFSALHPRLCHHLEGEPWPTDDDPYAIPGVPPAARDVVKVTLMKLLNAGPEVSIRAPAGARNVLGRRMTFPSLMAALEARHARIRGWFRRGRGVELQFIDALIAEQVLNYFSTAMERPVLPVHDSFIVARRDEYKLGQTMALAYRGVLSSITDVPGYPVIRGWSDPKLERKVMTPLALSG